MAVPHDAWGRSARTPFPHHHSEGQPPRHATSRAAGPLRHLSDADNPDCHRDRGLRRINHRHPERLLESPAMARHTGAPHEDSLGAILVPQLTSNLDQTVEGACPRGGISDIHLEGALSCQALHEPHLPEIADVTTDRFLFDCYHAELLGPCERRENA